MFRDIRKNRVFSRRALMLAGGKAVLTGALVTRLGYLQIFKHQKYSIQSDSNRIKPLISPAPRGEVLDRFGNPLTSNIKNYRLFLYLDQKQDVQKIVDRLIKILEISEENREIFINKIKNARRKSVVSLMDSLDWHSLARIESNSYALNGLSIESGIFRKYPYPAETAHFLGYVSLPSEKESEENESNLFLHPDFRIGKFGLEKTFDEALRGQYGVRYVEVDVHGVPLRTLSTKDSSPGSRLHLTIDLNLQKFVTERIKNDVASVVVLDVKTGEILSYASSPTFDPNNFVEGVSKEYWQELNEDPRKPLSNKPISAIYPPGSTFKLMVALAGLESGSNPEHRVTCNGSYRSGKRIFHCWKDGGHGSVNLMDAITQSCNTYFFTLANQIGYEKFTTMAKKFGYGEKIDISLYGARSGNVPDDEWKRKVFKIPWVGGDTLNTAIGQGFVLATPLQMALVTARIANGGVPIKPYLVRNHNILRQYDSLKNEAVIKEEHIKFVQEGMRRVVNDGRGTAFGKRLGIEGFEMAGKTGTSQVISKRENEMSKSEAKNNANHAIFVAFAPFHEPKYALSIVVEHGGAGSATAAPIARDIMTEIYNLNQS